MRKSGGGNGRNQVRAEVVCLAQCKHVDVERGGQGGQSPSYDCVLHFIQHNRKPLRRFRSGDLTDKFALKKIHWCSRRGKYRSPKLSKK